MVFEWVVEEYHTVLCDLLIIVNQVFDQAQARNSLVGLERIEISLGIEVDDMIGVFFAID